ncbi:MAG: diphosphomevalonate decarboxylase [Spirochaetes bacterium GWB1_48_6]|nr:MAG: diphosphomevalonate decarboxylase [Spirochaetes bacterium GWB1_48_6]
MEKKIEAIASPSLALIKYWGKFQGGGINLPATPSLAVTLEGMTTTTWAEENSEDFVTLDGKIQNPQRFSQFFNQLRQVTGSKLHFKITSENNFPTAAGLASSSSGFAALAGACSALTGVELKEEELSSLARVGSGSAARSIWGGFTVLPAAFPCAYQVADENFWPDFRIVLVTVTEQAKDHSSRDAMEHTRLTSPYYSQWVKDAAQIFPQALEALRGKDLTLLGHFARLSYLRMFSSMFAADDPLIYWLPESLGLIRMAEDLRREGLEIWETMDAGPQVKFFCTTKELPVLEKALKTLFPQLPFRVSKPGPGLRIRRIS